MGKQTYPQAMKTEVEALRLVNGKVTEGDLAAAKARFTLHQDLGLLADEWPTSYDLDDETRDRLIAHARQDAALACFQIANLGRSLQTLRRLVIGLLIATTFLLWAVIAG